jgi:hypothetical protein
MLGHFFQLSCDVLLKYFLNRYSESFPSVMLMGEKFGNIQAHISEAPESIYLPTWPLLPWDIILDKG